MNNRSGKSILIVGGGIGGCTLAHFLAERGIRATVVEKANQFSHKGFALVLGAPAGEVLRRMHLEHAFDGKEISVPMTSVYSDRGDLLRMYAHKARHAGEFPLTLHRADFHTALYDAVRNRVDFRFGTTLAEYAENSEGIVARFSDGREGQFDVLVAADGIRSSIRTKLFESEGECPLGAAFLAFLIPNRIGSHLSLGNVGLIGTTQYASVGVYASKEGQRVGGYFMYRSGEEIAPVSLQEKKKILTGMFATKHPFYRNVIEALHEDDYVVHDSLLQIDLPKWSSGRTVLLGDAAHSLTLVSGLGASMAMAGAYILAEELTRGGEIEVAFSRYEQRLRPAVERIQGAVRGKLKNIMPEGLIRRALVSNALRFAPETLLRQALARSIPDTVSF